MQIREREIVNSLSYRTIKKQTTKNNIFFMDIILSKPNHFTDCRWIWKEVKRFISVSLSEMCILLSSLYVLKYCKFSIVNF